MKKRILFGLMVLVLMLSGHTIKAQALSANLFSQNGWMTDTVGGGTNPFDSTQCPGLKYGYNMPCYVAGKLYQQLANVQASKVKLIRYGGTPADQNNPTKSQYLRFVDSVRVRGMEPVLQISVNLGEVGINATVPYDTLNAKNIINYINNTMGRGVTYWSIGNEPDNALPYGYGYSTNAQAILIANYIKNFSKAMRRASSVAIKIVGPELAGWSSDPGYTKKLLVDSLLTPGQRCDITGFDPVTSKPWIDVFSFHYYGGINGDGTSVPRATLIAKQRNTYDLAQTLDYLNTKLTYANSYYTRTTTNPITSAITEANIDFQSNSTDAFNDVKCNGFFAGQYWSEIASIAAEKGVNFVNFWSAAENSMGYMKDDGTKKSAYYHYKTMAENFIGTYYTGSDNQTNIKAFGSKSGSQIAVMVLNQDTVTTASKIYSIRLDNTTPGSTNWIKMNMGTFSTLYTDTIEASSSTLLLFDLSGSITYKSRYKQSAGSSSAGFIPAYSLTCLPLVSYTNQTQLNSAGSGSYSRITIGNGSNYIKIGASNNHVYKAGNAITVKGNFTVPTGQTLRLLTNQCN